MRGKHKTLRKRSYENNATFTNTIELYHVVLKTRNL